jgi:transcriptional regulator with XRE-family HTH domain
MSFGSRLAGLRKKKGKLQAEVAKDIGVARATYGAYEQNKREPDLDTLEKLANYYDVSIDYLLARIDQPYPDPLLTVTGPRTRTPFKGIGLLIHKMISDRRIKRNTVMDLLNLDKFELNSLYAGEIAPTEEQAESLAHLLGVNKEVFLPKKEVEQSYTTEVAGQEIKLSLDELKLFEELKKHPILFHDLSSNPQKKVKELIKLYKMKKMFLDENDEEYGDGFGDIED